MLFQSLLHQGISLLPFPCARRRPASCPSFNPFFIRASVYWITSDALSLKCSICFNPFFIRASVYCIGANAQSLALSFSFQSLLHQGISLLREEEDGSHTYHVFVSIPSSSGHQFTDGMAARNVVFPALRFNPFFIRASVYWLFRRRRKARLRLEFQSLLHQGISLLFDVYQMRRPP